MCDFLNPTDGGEKKRLFFELWNGFGKGRQVRQERKTKGGFERKTDCEPGWERDWRL